MYLLKIHLKTFQWQQLHFVVSVRPPLMGTNYFIIIFYQIFLSKLSNFYEQNEFRHHSQHLDLKIRIGSKDKKTSNSVFTY